MRTALFVLTPEQSEIMMVIVPLTSGGSWTLANQDVLICMHSPLGEEVGGIFLQPLRAYRLPITEEPANKTLFSTPAPTAPTDVAAGAALLRYSWGNILSGAQILATLRRFGVQSEGMTDSPAAKKINQKTLPTRQIRHSFSIQCSQKDAYK